MAPLAFALPFTLSTQRHHAPTRSPTDRLVRSTRSTRCTSIRPYLQTHTRASASAASRTASPSGPSNTTAVSRALIVGANRGLGLALLRALRARWGPSATINTTRRASSAASEAQLRDSTLVEELEATNSAAVKDVVQRLDPDVVFCVVGGRISGGGADQREEDDEDDDDKKNDDNVDLLELPDIAAARALANACTDKVGTGGDGSSGRLRRLIYVSALGAGNSEGSVPFQVMETLRPLLLAKSHAESYIRATAPCWTIVRPAPLSDPPHADGDVVSDAVATEDVDCYGTVARDDLARVLVDIAESQAAEGRTLHVVDQRRVLVTAPYVRPLEVWEPLPFAPFAL